MRHLRGIRHPSQLSMILLIVMALVSGACAGSVGKYRNATPQSGGLGVPATPGSDDAVGAFTQTDDEQFATGSSSSDGLPVGVEGVATGTGGKGDATPDFSAPVAAGPAGIGSTVGVTNDTIKIGLFYPKTGHYAPLVRGVPEAIQAAFDEAGRIHGRKLVLQTYDDGTSNASTIQAEEKRAKDEVFAYMSHVAESDTILAPLANQHRVPVVLGNIDETVARPLRYAFTLLAYWRYQATILPGFIKNYLRAGSKRIGIVYEGTSTAKAARDAFKTAAKASKLKVVFEQPIAQNQSTCSNEVSNLAANDVELVFMMSGPLAAICMLRDARALGYRPIWTGVGGTWNSNPVSTASGDAAEGIRMLSSWTTMDTPCAKHYSDVMRKRGNNSGANDHSMAVYYTEALSLIEALRRTGPSLGRESFVRTFETKMNGYQSGCLAPPHFGPGDRSGPRDVTVVACCTDNDWWYTVESRWRSRF